MLKYLDDYIDKIQEKFPDLEKWEIQKICEHGFRGIYSLSNHGADLLLKSSNSFSLYFGKTFADNVLFSRYYAIKKRIKLRILYHRKNPIWDGYYYAGLTEEEYQTILPDKKGRWKQKVNFDGIWFYKNYEEAFITKRFKYVIRYKTNDDRGLAFKANNLEIRNFDLYATRDSQGKMQTISD